MAQSILRFCGDFEMRIARDGTWYHQGRPIRRKPLVQLFSTVLHRDAAGAYWLETPVEKGRITVEDAPFTVVECDLHGQGHDQIVRLRTNLDLWLEVGEAHPLRVETDPDSGEPRPYVLVRDRLEALILRPVFYQLAELAVEADGEAGPVIGLWSKRRFFVLA